MFRCCVCNESSKKSKKDKKFKAEEEEAESECEIILENEKKRPNGVKTSSSIERLSVDVKNNETNSKSVPNSPLENSENREKSDATIDPESTKKLDEIGKKNSTDSSHDNLSEKSSLLESPKEIISDTKVENNAASKQKSFIYTNPIVCTDTPAFIERTIVDGSDEDGDDSVFEAFSTDPDQVEVQAPATRTMPKWLSQEEDDDKPSEGCDGMQEPPATPVARDELALRRHRFFSDLLQAARNTTEHRVHFDPLGPVVHSGCETEDRDEHLENLVTRLENVTKRLENVPSKLLAQTQETAVQTKTPSPKRPNRSNGELASLETLKVSNKVEIMSVSSYEDLVAGPVSEYLKLSQKIGGDVATHSKLVEKVFRIQLQFIKTASSRPAPSSQPEQVSLLGPTSTTIQEIQEYREKNRGSQFFNHLSAISESIPALGWVAVSPTPAPYVKEMNDAGQFYTNRVLKDWKEKDKTHVEWCKAWVQTLSDLQQYVRKHHTTGLVWAKSGSAPVPPPPGGMPPPPPPSMPIGDVGANVGDDRSALFAQINQGENITRSLKKVTSDMQSHKNSSIRTGPAPFKAPVTTTNSANFKSVPSANLPIDKPPVFTRDGKKWLIEYHKGNKDLLVESSEMNNVVYMFRCQDSTLVVKGKINSIVIDSCRKSSIVFDSLVSSIEFVNCQSVQMQVLGKVPTISIDKTDGCQMYLSPDSLDVALISSKSTEMNVLVPKGNGDYTEHPVPEQFKTTIGKNGLSTTAVDALG